MPKREIVEIPTDSIKAQALERNVSDKGITDLANSINQVGILEPLLVLLTDKGYNLLAGKRRLMAAKELGLPTVPCLIVETDQSGAFAITLHENMYREDLNPVDESIIYEQLRDKHGYNTRETAKMVGQSEGYVSQRLAIITWPEKLTHALFYEHINFSVARELSIVTNLTHLTWLLKNCVESGANYRTVRRWRTEWQAQVKEEAEPPDYTKPPAEELPIPELERDCWWCDRPTKISRIIHLEFCTECYKGLQSNKQLSVEGSS